MSKTTHSAAIVVRDDEPYGIVVEVEPELFEDPGGEFVYDLILDHPWVSRQGIPLVVGYVSDDEAFLVGPDDLADYVAENWEDVLWNYPLTIEWDDVDAVN